MQQRQNKGFRSDIHPGDQSDCMIFLTLISGRLLCGIFPRSFSISTVMAVNPGKLKFLGWDFLSAQWPDSNISCEILPLYIERIQVSLIRSSLCALSRLKYLHIPISQWFTCIYQYVKLDIKNEIVHVYKEFYICGEIVSVYIKWIGWQLSMFISTVAVSYTHLTLPTICSV